MIRIEGVSVSFEEDPVLDGVDLTVEAGEFVGLVGRNGAGKTTLLRTINGSLDPDAGGVLLDGTDVADLSSRAASRRVATVPQETNVRFAFDVRSIVAMGRTPHRTRFSRDPDRADHVDRALGRTETAQFADRRVDTLSGGERKRVFIARALAQDAPALVLDEPTASLDINHTAATLDLVGDLADDGRAVLAAVHDLEAAARYCDRLAVLHDGELLAVGPPEGVLTRETLDVAFDAPSVVTPNPVTDTPSVTTLPRSTAGTARVHVLGGGPTGARIVATCWAAGHRVSVGPLAPGDVALSVADSLGVSTEVVPPFAPLGETVRGRLGDSVRGADATVLADLTVDPELATVRAAETAETLLVVEERPLAERNHAGREGRRRYEELRDGATVLAPEKVPGAVSTAGGPDTVAGGSQAEG